MSGASDGFTVHETHRILLQPGFEIDVASDKQGWSSLYAHRCNAKSLTRDFSTLSTTSSSCSTSTDLLLSGQ